jgi:Asp-tRNA(Asn)/Glu-tRNA(Gln) amidotransferase A subunit family amidase
MAFTAPEPRRPQRLIRLCLKAWEEVEAPHRQIFEAEMQRLRNAGIELLDRDNNEHVRALEEQLDHHVDGSSAMVAYDMRWPFTGYAKRYGDRIGERIHGIVQRAVSISPADYAVLLENREIAREATRKVLSLVDADAFVMPAASGPAPRGLEFTGSRAYLVYWSWLGFPAFSLPTMEADGMPWGLQVMHVAERDDELCAVAGWLMKTCRSVSADV